RGTGGAVRGAKAEVTQPILVPPGLFGHAPDAGYAAERRPAVAGTEQRAAVVAEGAVEHVAIFVVEARAGQCAHVAHRLQARRDVRIERRVRECEHVFDRERLTRGAAAVLTLLVPRAAELELAIQVVAQRMLERAGEARIHRFVGAVANADVAVVLRRGERRGAVALDLIILAHGVPVVVTEHALERDPRSREVTAREIADEPVRRGPRREVLIGVEEGRTAVAGAAEAGAAANEDAAAQTVAREVVGTRRRAAEERAEQAVRRTVVVAAVVVGAAHREGE